MTKQNPIFTEMEKLSKDIVYYADQYFNKDKTLIQNHVYDDMVKRFEELREQYPEYAELFEVHNKPVPIHEPTSNGLKVIKFTNPMQSLKKALSWEDVERFLAKLPKDTAYFYEVKIDGLALEIHYVNRKLLTIFTRGDGLEGEDVTHALPLFGHIPLELPEWCPENFTVRGEGAITNETFRLYNETAVKKAANPRNAVSGWVRASLENQNQAVKGLLTFYIYWSDDNLGNTEYDKLRLSWTIMGFYPSPEASLEAIKENLECDIVPTDGIVIKVRNLELYKELGGNSRHPHGAIAYKYPFEEAETTPADVEWNTTKTGRVVPVIIYSPVQLGGVTCTRALLDNYYQFVSLGLRTDSHLVITRNGDVIPRLDRVINAGEGKLFEAPTECPSCSSVLEVRKGRRSAELVCTNVTECPAQLLMRCVALVHKKCLDIDDLGPVKLAELIEREHIFAPAHILALNERNVGEKIANRIREVRKGVPLHRAIKALGLPGVDLTRAKKLANAIPSTHVGRGILPTKVLDWLYVPENIMSVPGFSTGLTLGISTALRHEEFYENARDTLKWLEINHDTDNETLIKGVITGSLGREREELTEYFGKNGIELVENLTRDCQFIIAGEKPSSSKVLKATELDIPMVEATKVSSVDKLIATVKGLVK